MLNSKDKRDPGNKSDPDKPYVGYKNTPLDTRFKPGQSGNPRGRPKGRSKDLNLVNLGELFTRELYKTVVANVNGKVVKKSQAEVLVFPSGKTFGRPRFRTKCGACAKHPNGRGQNKRCESRPTIR